MGGCCNARTLSIVSASFQIVGTILCMLFAALILLGVTSFSYRSKDIEEIVTALGIILAVIIIIVALFNLVFLIIVIVGVNQNRLTLVSIYVYPTIVCLVIQAIFVIYLFISGFVDGIEVSSIFLNLFHRLIIYGFQLLMFSPIYIFHKRLRNPHFQPEHHDLRSNQPIHKPQYAA